MQIIRLQSLKCESESPGLAVTGQVRRHDRTVAVVWAKARRCKEADGRKARNYRDAKSSFDFHR